MKKFKKGDLVLIIAGADKGKQGNILSVSGEKVIVEGINLKTIHKKPSQQKPGEIIKKEGLIHASNISHISDGKPSKIGYKANSPKSKKSRFIKKTGNII
jgi:large subunit ribosomal protein L24